MSSQYNRGHCGHRDFVQLFECFLRSPIRYYCSVPDNQLTSHCSSLNCKQETYMKLDVCVFSYNRGQVDCVKQKIFFCLDTYFCSTTVQLVIIQCFRTVIVQY